MTELLRILFDESISDFFNLESRNITGDTSERNLCGRLAMIIEKKLIDNRMIGYYADPEYNRMEYDKGKKIWVENKSKTVCCDLIVHSRGEIPDNDNLIAIEMKKSGRKAEDIENDKNRLRSMTSRIGPSGYVNEYKIGFYIELDIEQNKYGIEEFREGHSVDNCIWRAF